MRRKLNRCGKCKIGRTIRIKRVPIGETKSTNLMFCVLCGYEKVRNN